MIRLYVSPLAGGHHRLLDVFRRTCAEFTLYPHDDPFVHEVVVNIGDRWWINPAPEAVAIAAGIPVEACWSSHAAFASGATVSTPCADAVAVRRPATGPGQPDATRSLRVYWLRRCRINCCWSVGLLPMPFSSG